jgi:putative ABC transport system ATP-binding protein
MLLKWVWRMLSDMNNNIILEMKNVWKTYESGKKSIHALSGFIYNFKRSSFNIVTGPSGSGKSTLIRIAGLLETPTKGKISLNGEDTTNIVKSKKTSLIREEIGFIFQSGNLLPPLTVIENVMLPMISSDLEKAKNILHLVEFSEYDKFPKELSIEEELRVTIARALVNNHSLILADEPTGNLQKKNSDNIMELLQDLNKKKKLTIIMTTNNILFSELPVNLIEMRDGAIIK